MSVNERAAAPMDAEAAADAGRGDGPFRMAALTIPADKNYLALARTAAMHVAALLRFPVGDVTDLRLAVDEACTAFLAVKPLQDGDGFAPGGELNLELCFDRYGDRLEVGVRGPVQGEWPDREEIGWLMLQALVGEARVERDAHTATLTLLVPFPAPR